jgi:hypothetical protein
MVVVDRLSKKRKFVPLQNTEADTVAKAFL